MIELEPELLDPDFVAAEFPTTLQGIYANHAAMSPWPRRTANAVSEFARDNLESGPLKYAGWLKLETALRERLARLLNAPAAEDIALVSNTSSGINHVANGLNWWAGDNIVTAEDEFVSNRLAWDALGQRGVDIRRADIREALDPEEALIRLLDERTRVLTISSVQWSDGFRLDLGRLGAACKASGALFFVDAIQQFGALPIDVQADNIDCLAAGSHKWQMGPEGMGVFYCNAGTRRQLAVSQHGWRALDDPYRFERARREPSQTGRRFEPGSPNTMGQIALDASLSLLEEIGPARAGGLVLANTARLMDAIRSIPGLSLRSRSDEERRSGIVSVMPHALRLYEAHQRLRLRGVTVAQREGALRISPHYYQAGRPMDRLLNALEDIVKE